MAEFHSGRNPETNGIPQWRKVMANIKVSIINESTVLTDQQVNAAVPAFQTQVSQDFAKAWGINADLTFVGGGQQPDANSWWLVILDNSDQAGALGYGLITGPNGRRSKPLEKARRDHAKDESSDVGGICDAAGLDVRYGADLAEELDDKPDSDQQ